MLDRKNGNWSNSNEDRVLIVPYQSSWPSRFEEEAAAIRNAVPKDIPVTIVHVGSTAVPGLAAKPIVDIMLWVPDRRQWPSLVEPLEALSYVLWLDNPHTDRLFFVKGMPPYGRARTHHVHVRERCEVEKAVIFRDYLRAHPEEAAQYEALKRKLAKSHETDREAYTVGKSEFVKAVLRRARHE